MFATTYKTLFHCRSGWTFLRSHQAIAPTFHLWNVRTHSTPVPSMAGPGDTSSTHEQETATSKVKVIGWIQSIRRHKTRVFFDLSDGTTSKNLQVVAPPNLLSENVRVGSAVSIEGHLAESPITSVKSGHAMELKSSHELIAHAINLLSPITELKMEPNVSESGVLSRPIEGTLGAQTPRPDLGLLRSENGLAWRHRLPEFAALLRLRAQLKSIVRNVMQQLEYLEVDTPILTTANCEGSSESFVVQPATEKTKWSSEPPVHLTGSAQLHLEALALGLSKVYTLSPTFRAESSNTRHHLAEFHMLEAESVQLSSVDLLCNEIETLIRLVLQEFLKLFRSNPEQEETSEEHNSSRVDLALVLSSLTSEHDWMRPSHPGALDTSCLTEHTHRFTSLLTKPFVRITFEDAVNYLSERFGTRQANMDFTKEEERHLVDWFGESGPIFVTHFPSSLKPFYCLSLDGVRAEAVDLLLPVVGELVGGSVRETDESVLRQRLPTSSTGPGSLEWYCDLRGLGGAPHGGFGLGFERLLQILLGVHNIRDVIPFPRVMNKIIL